MMNCYACPIKKYEYKKDWESAAKVFLNSRNPDLDFINNPGPNIDQNLDDGIRDIVTILIANGIKTTSSCEGGRGHGYYWPTVEFEGSIEDARKAVKIAIDYKLPVWRIHEIWLIDESYENNCKENFGWEMIFMPPANSHIWRNSNDSKPLVLYDIVVASACDGNFNAVYIDKKLSYQKYGQKLDNKFWYALGQVGYDFEFEDVQIKEVDFGWLTYMNTTLDGTPDISDWKFPEDLMSVGFVRNNEIHFERR